MGFLGLSFESPEERRQKQKEFEKKIFPFGLDAHRELVKDRLAQIMTSPILDEERMFAFIVAKEKYLLEDNSAEGMMRARLQLKKIRDLNEADIELIIALVHLDSRLTSLEGYPTPQMIRAAES
ncbi:MAG: hypothetical protein LBL49_01355 [Clostridiales Family XIII bacterium]|jgi:hypothetical protein|nr:hypothetical protein [Clostridiales Family XIII bacterium]